MPINFLRSGLFHLGLRDEGILLAKQTKQNRCLFLDRDGVIIKECHYIKDVALVELEKGVKDLILMMRKQGYLIFVVTNQSGIDRGYFGWDEYEQVTREMCRQLGPESIIDGVIAWGGLSDSDFRKPGNRMLKVFESMFAVNMSESILIGDKLSDLIAGSASGLGLLVHVMTGHGASELAKFEETPKSLPSKFKYLKHEPSNTQAVSINDLSEFGELLIEEVLHKH